MLLGFLDVRGILPLDVFTAIAAVVPVALFRIPQPEAQQVQGTGVRAVIRDLGEGLRYIWEWKGMRWFMATTLIWGVFVTPLMSFQPLLVTQYFKGGAAEVGWMSSSFGIGMLAGGTLLSVWGGFPRRLTTSIIGTVITCLGRLMVGIAPPTAFWLAIVGQFITGLGFSAHTSGTRAAEQAVVAPEMQGRFFAVSFSIFTALSPISLSIFGPLADIWGVRVFWFLMPIAGGVLAAIRRWVPSIYNLEDAGADGRATVQGDVGKPKPAISAIVSDVD
jgi:DHA3 family macrolide efflux protein-like MFS transporter